MRCRGKSASQAICVMQEVYPVMVPAGQVWNSKKSGKIEVSRIFPKTNEPSVNTHKKSMKHPWTNHEMKHPWTSMKHQWTSWTSVEWQDAWEITTKTSKPSATLTSFWSCSTASATVLILILFCCRCFRCMAVWTVCPAAWCLSLVLGGLHLTWLLYITHTQIYTHMHTYLYIWIDKKIDRLCKVRLD